ncbi:WD repeat protein [Arthroderma uncinatum]|uniref:WD repeat protein n=1 Tax=Arthroderma uncinatum TaxID=74035 RepID=UPI00144A54FD|nr:WD repeat protein [Arthroderma uncinatum]KAF3480845.1 WD repeat protein [Arthroderma uncinatum]
MVDQSETGAGQSSSQSATHPPATTHSADDLTKQEDLAMNEELTHADEAPNAPLHTGEESTGSAAGFLSSPVLLTYAEGPPPLDPLLDAPLFQDSFLSDLSHVSAALSVSDFGAVPSIFGSILPPAPSTNNTAQEPDATGYENYSDRDSDVPAPPNDSSYDIPATFMQDTSNDTDDGWNGGQWNEGQEGGSLIEDSELSGFEFDKLPQNRVGMGFGSDSTSSDNDADVAEQFYPSDDEDEDDEPYRRSGTFYGNLDAMFTYGQTNAGNNADGPITPPTEQPSPLPALDLENNELTDYYFDGVGNDTDNADLSMHTESMDNHFLSPFYLNSSLTPSSISMPLTQAMNSLTIGGGTSVSDSKGIDLINSLHWAFVRLLELVTSSVGILPLPPPLLSRICHVLGKFSSLHQRVMAGLLEHGIQFGRHTMSISTPVAAPGIPFGEDEDSDPFIPPLPNEYSEESLSTNASSSEETVIPRSEPEPRPPPLLTREEYEDLHEPSELSPYYIPPAIILQSFNAPTASTLLAALLAPADDANQNPLPAFERNLTVEQFIRQWYIRGRLNNVRISGNEPYHPVSSEAIHVLQWARPTKISRPENHQSRTFDIQNIPWQQKLNVDRAAARSVRDRWYTSYHNLRFQPHGYAVTLRDSERYFKAKTMYTKFKASMAHFQLRNLMSVTASNTVQYVHRSKVYSVTPFYDLNKCLIDLSDSSSATTFFEPVKISTMKAKHGVTIAGGFCGEYAYRAEVNDYKKIEGRVTKHPNGITNHIDIVKHRTSRNPQAVIASNDESIRILDCETNKFVASHRFARAINCTDTSPDGRLRVIVGDSADAWVVDSDTGKPVQALTGHRDYGFACAWSPDMLHIATSNQDKTVNIWDARMWRILQTMDSDVAGYRSLRFSPVGGGPRTLLMCEPADRIAIVNAQTYETRQVHDFFGEIGGADFTPDGGRIWVANMDSRFGGLMEYDRVQWGQEFGISHTRRSKIESRGDVYHPDLPNEWLPEAELDDDPRCVLGPGERRLRFERLMSDTEFANLNRFLG